MSEKLSEHIRRCGVERLAAPSPGTMAAWANTAEAMESKLDRMQRENERLKTENKELEEEIGNHEAENESIGTRVCELEERNARLKKIIDNVLDVISGG